MDLVLCNTCGEKLCYTGEICVVVEGNFTRHVCIKDEDFDSMHLVPSSDPRNPNPMKSEVPFILLCRRGHFVGSQVPMLASRGAKSSSFLDGKRVKVRSSNRFDKLLIDWKRTEEPECRLLECSESQKNDSRTHMMKPSTDQIAQYASFSDKVHSRAFVIKAGTELECSLPVMESQIATSKILTGHKYTHLKLSHNNEVRAILFRKEDNLQYLKSIVMKTFKEIPVSTESTDHLTITYKDGDGDMISIKNDQDLYLALTETNLIKKFVISVHPQLENLTSRNSVETGKPIVCRYFKETGYCKYGPRCKFTHRNNKDGGGPSQDTQSPYMPSRQIENWLQKHLEMSASNNIEELSSDYGLQKVHTIVEQRHLLPRLKDLLVKLLVKDEIRMSLLRHMTNKIYGVLLGSQFLLELHVHVRGLPKPSEKVVRSYVLLAEELQLRTECGWREVPLDTLNSVIDELPDTSLKDELKVVVIRLLEQRARMKLLKAVTEPDMSFQGHDFRDISIIPNKEELFSRSEPVPVNKIGTRYTSVIQYLETHFQLLREDFVDPLRQGIKEYQRLGHSSHDIRLYSNVQLIGISCGNSGISYRISLSVESAKTVDWDSTNSLMFGSLLCITSDKFQSLIWATVSNRENSLLKRGEVDVRIVGDSETKLETSRTYVMVESSAAYFEAYSHVLTALQKQDMEYLPFLEHLMSLEPTVEAPSYLINRPDKDMYNLECSFPETKEELGKTSLSLLQEWPKWTCHLDNSQKLAVKFGLTKRLALIQGAPGTGKTFVGLLIVKILLANLRRKVLPFKNREASRPKSKSDETENSEGDIGGPILIVCYTNHALDQFLEGIYSEETNLIRIGGQSKSNVLKGCHLHEIVQASRAAHDLNRSHTLATYEARKRQTHLEKKILECIQILKSEFVTPELLHGVATEEQIESLFFKLEEAKTYKIVQIWLNYKDDSEWVASNSTHSHHQEVDQEVDVRNPYQILEDDIEEASVTCSIQEKDYQDEILLRSNEADRRDETRQGSVKTNIMNYLNHVSGAVGSSEVFEKHDNNTWITVRTKRPGNLTASTQHGVSAQQIGDVSILQHEDREQVPLHIFVDAPDVWLLTPQRRRMLHYYWLTEIKSNAQQTLTKLSKEYEEACKILQEVGREIQLTVLRRARVVGMTTTAAARNHDILKSLQPEIVIVEEAAEILESHILACLTPTTKHLILIGDHMQLRPSVAVYKLAVEHKLDVSLFERLVKSGVEHITLQVQRRMRPSISSMISTLYPDLKDHASVTLYDNIKGMKSNVFFFDHKAPEEDNGGSKVNVVEARLAVELCMYLLNQGCYKHNHITILSMYSGQIKEIRNYLSQRMKEQADFYVSLENEDCSKNSIPRVSSVDDYQGEECDIIILSLVRSNDTIGKDGPGTIGFLSIENRVCVALSRAKKGLYIFGNAELLAERSSLWKTVIESLAKTTSISTELILCCQNHPKVETPISKIQDFKAVQDGGCSQACEYQLDCGHACPRRCHIASHDMIICPKPCRKLYDGCKHRCTKLCHGAKECRPCTEVVARQIPKCGHVQNMQCSMSVEDVFCSHPCERTLNCGHPCPRPCGKPCALVCRKVTVKDLPCKHSAKVPCCEDVSTYSCSWPCGKILKNECQHICKGTCGTCKQGTLHIACMQKCNQDLPCGHQCETICSVPCPPCAEICRNRCLHSRCGRTCGELCQPCLEVCTWNCPHFSCGLLCHEACERPRCNKPCQLILKECGHKCLGLCGEPCPKKCRICEPKTLDVIAQMTLDEFEETDRFVELIDCGHLFEASGLDRWMEYMDETLEGNNAAPIAIVLKKCPECKTPIRRTQRYANIVKRRLARLEEVKKRMFGYDRLHRGNMMMERQEYAGACAEYLNAIRINPGLLEAHFSMGCVMCRLSKFNEAVSHLEVVVRSSSFYGMLSSIPDFNPRTNYCSFAERQSLKQVTSKATQSQAIKAMVQMASALTSLKKFSAAAHLCDAVLKVDPDNKDASQLTACAKTGITYQVVHAMETAMSGGGRWYECPNGHIYVVQGECGEPMEISRCPDCKAWIGGFNDSPAKGNVHYNPSSSEF